MAVVEMWIERDGSRVVSVRGDVSEDGDLTRLNGVLMTEFRHHYPNDSLLGPYKIAWDKVTEGH